MVSMFHYFISFIICPLVMCALVPNESISSHVLDTVAGEPAERVAISAFFKEGDDWKRIGETYTGTDGRVPWVSPGFALKKGTYKLIFAVEDYYKRKSMECFYPYVEVVFKVDDPSRHYHIPITLSPYAYSTYRGS
ncbi:hydroxyisourate hydrolase [Teladorsagia circumcincta]|uniref:5-hydroxyisourate hydrolase n=1 Tax=Teladorsagia circumcincta TaxID=45464 RepID=A0A2G9TUL6_TELCI|nr:hydroxyisourate hydrolase [Teladorsagia circumcincta]